MSLLSELHSKMVEYRFRPNKKLAQHFVVSEKLVQKLVELAELKKQDTVLEIGPGTGVLTRELLKKSNVVGVEIDEALCRLLQDHLPKLRLVCGDFLKEDLPKFNKVVCLPPYSKSKAIMQRLLETEFELGIMVFQKEFAFKLAAFPGFKDYNALSVLAQYYFEVEAGQSVPSNCFFPKPKDESCILSLKRHNQFPAVKDKAGFALFVKTVFRFKNKNLANALKKSKMFVLPGLKMSEKEFDEKISKLPLLEEKVNLLDVKQFAETFNKIA